MKKAIAVAAFVFPVLCQAQGISGDKMRECGQKAWLFSMAAQFRDSRQSPQEFMKFVEHNHPNPLVLSDAYIKRAANAVYFDDEFSSASSDMLYSAISQECMNPTPQYQPLK